MFMVCFYGWYVDFIWECDVVLVIKDLFDNDVFKILLR